MIVNIRDKSYQTRSDVSNFNWLKSNEWVVIPDNADLTEKVRSFYPRYDLVFDDNGKVIDVVEIPKTETEKMQERVNEIDNELKRIDNEGVTRHLENQIEASGTIDTIYITTKELIERKKELRKERETLAEKIKE